MAITLDRFAADCHAALKSEPGRGTVLSVELPL